MPKKLFESITFLSAVYTNYHEIQMFNIIQFDSILLKIDRSNNDLKLEYNIKN